jgi:hypothetical protein
MLGEVFEQKRDAEEHDDDADARQRVAAGKPRPEPIRAQRRR